jgi:hypothetical protein
LEQAHGFGMFMLKAVISGRGDELVDLAKVNLFRSMDRNHASAAGEKQSSRPRIPNYHRSSATEMNT